jgi:hypothetical protein
LPISENAIASRNTRTNVLYLVIGALTVAVAVLAISFIRTAISPKACTSNWARAACRFKEIKANSGAARVQIGRGLKSMIPKSLPSDLIRLL